MGFFHGEALDASERQEGAEVPAEHARKVRETSIGFLSTRTSKLRYSRKPRNFRTSSACSNSIPLRTAEVAEILAKLPAGAQSLARSTLGSSVLGPQDLAYLLRSIMAAPVHGHSRRLPAAVIAPHRVVPGLGW